MKKVEYDYLPPFGTDLKALKLPSDKFKETTLNAFQGLDGSPQPTPASGESTATPTVTDAVGDAQIKSSFLNNSAKEELSKGMSRRRLGSREIGGINEQTGEFIPIYSVGEQQYVDGSTHQRTPWSTTKKHFTFEGTMSGKGPKNRDSNKSIICSIAQPTEQSETYCASSTSKAPWSSHKRMYTTNNPDHVDLANGTGGPYGGGNGTDIPFDPNAAYYKRVIRPVLSPTESLYGPSKETMKKQFDRRHHDTSQVMDPPVESPQSKRKVVSPRFSPTEGKWWTQNTYTDNVGAKPEQWKTTYELNSAGHEQLSPRRAKHFEHFRVPKHQSTYELSHEIHNSPRVQNARNRKEYHKAKDWFNSIRKPEYVRHIGT